MEVITKCRMRNQDDAVTSINNISIIKKIPGTSSMLLVLDDSLELNDKNEDKADSIIIYKIQFLASCKVENFEKEMLIAFYIDTESGTLEAFIVSALPTGHYQDQNFRLVDYKSYCEICELTGETKLSFADYFFTLKTGSIGMNTLMRWNNTVHNYDKQPDFLKKYDEEFEKVKNN